MDAITTNQVSAVVKVESTEHSDPLLARCRSHCASASVFHACSRRALQESYREPKPQVVALKVAPCLTARLRLVDRRDGAAAAAVVQAAVQSAKAAVAPMVELLWRPRLLVEQRLVRGRLRGVGLVVGKLEPRPRARLRLRRQLVRRQRRRRRPAETATSLLPPCYEICWQLRHAVLYFSPR